MAPSWGQVSHQNPWVICGSALSSGRVAQRISLSRGFPGEIVISSPICSSLSAAKFLLPAEETPPLELAWTSLATSSVVITHLAQRAYANALFVLLTSIQSGHGQSSVL